MFPSAFETSVYTVQATVCPKDTMVNPLSYRQCTPAVSVFKRGSWTTSNAFVIPLY